jgi:hypothetical protein
MPWLCVEEGENHQFGRPAFQLTIERAHVYI